MVKFKTTICPTDLTWEERNPSSYNFADIQKLVNSVSAEKKERDKIIKNDMKNKSNQSED